MILDNQPLPRPHPIRIHLAHLLYRLAALLDRTIPLDAAFKARFGIGF